jgi:uncharacterized protein (TIGR02996 family)
MGTERDLLEAIQAAPGDDAPRLVYGDFLLAKGDPRGELVQVQCRLADPAITTAEHRRLRAAENKLLAAHGAGWNEAVLDAIGHRDGRTSSTLITPIRVEMRRGFVDAIRAPADVLGRLDTLFAAAPLLTKLQLDPLPPYERTTLLKAKDLDSPYLANLRSLHVTMPGNGDEGATLIARCPHLTNLRELVLELSRLEFEPMDSRPREALLLAARGAEALSSSPWLANVRKLVLDGNRLGAKGVAALLDAPRWQLEELSLGTNVLDEAAIMTIAKAASLARLRALSLAGNSVTPAAAASLAASPHLRRLTELSFEGAHLRSKGIAALLGAMGLESLTTLNLASTGLGDEGAQVVARSAKILQLRVLNLRKNQIGKKALAKLAMSENLAGLEKILVYDRESKEAREAFLASPYLHNTEIYFRGKLLSKAAKAETVEAKATESAKEKSRAKKTSAKVTTSNEA